MAISSDTTPLFTGAHTRTPPPFLPCCGDKQVCVCYVSQECLAALYAAVCKGACQRLRELAISTKSGTPFSSTHLHFLALALTWKESFPCLTPLKNWSPIDPTQTLAVPALALALTRSVPALKKLHVVGYRHDVLAFDEVVGPACGNGRFGE